jgi:hypothetical protein
MVAGGDLMAKLGSTKRPLILRVASDENAMVAVGICEQHGWHYVLGVEPGKPEDLRDLARALRQAERSDEMGAMAPFAERFPDLARRETRIAIVGPNDTELPEDEYVFVENYCTDPSCDCRRVLLAVMSTKRRAQVATINYAFDPPSADDLDPEQTFLDPLNLQSDLSPALLDLFEHVVLEDEAYRRRLERHYGLIKGSAVRRIVAPAHHTIAPLRRSLTPEERAREANRRKRLRKKHRKHRK